MNGDYDDDYEGTGEENRVPSVDDALRGGGGAPVFKLEDRSSVTGTLKSAKMTPVLYPKDHPKAGQHKRYEKTGKKAYQIALTLTDTDDERRDNDDDGTRRVFVKEFGRQRDALAAAMDEHKFDKIADAFGSQLTVSHEGETVPVFKGGSGEKIVGFKFHSATDKALARGKTEPARKETRTAAPKRKTTEDLLREYGLPPELAAVVGDDPTPELLEALKAQHAKNNG